MNLVAFCAYIADQICGVKLRTRGKQPLLGTMQQGDFEDHLHWNAGISKALKFIKDRNACPTLCQWIKKLQKQKRPTK